MHKPKIVGAMVTGANLLAWLVVGTYSAHASMPHNPIHLPLESIVDARSWAPQGWAFFTRDAHEEQIEVLVDGSDGSWRSANEGPNASAANLFGASRRGRATNNEAGTLLQSVPKSAWIDCTADVSSCASAAPLVHVVNPLGAPTLCGAVAFAARRAVPWAWARGPKNVRMPERVARVEVKC